MSTPDLVVSTAFMGACLAGACFARRAVERRYEPGLVRELFFEAIAAAELCACCFELIIVTDNFGVATYAVCLFFLTIWWSSVWGDASACPYTHMEDMCEGRTSPRVVALKTWAQLMGGCCVYRIVQVFWWLEIAGTHHDRAFAECSADLQVNVYLGAFIEGLATLLCRLASRALGEMAMPHSSVIDSFVGTTLVVAAFDYSGGYFNPVLATALKWGCSGHTNWEHIIVYWIGACSGALLSVPLFRVRRVRDLLLGRPGPAPVDADKKDD